MIASLVGADGVPVAWWGPEAAAVVERDVWSSIFVGPCDLPSATALREMMDELHRGVASVTFAGDVSEAVAGVLRAP